MDIMETIKGSLGNNFFELLSKELIKQLLPDLSFIDAEKIAELPDSCKRAKKSLEDAKNNSEEQVKILLPSIEQQFKNKFKNLETNINLLSSNVQQLVPRMTGYIADIVGTCAVGPTISINKIPTIISQLKSDSETLGKIYNDTETSFQEFLMGLNPEELQKNVPGVGAIIGLMSGVLGTTAGILAIFGISRGGIDAEGNEPAIELPIDPPELLPADCQNYTPDEGHISTEPKECRYCTRFVPSAPKKSIYEFQDTDDKTAQEQYDEWLANWIATERAKNPCGFSCNDCKFFKKR